MLRRLSVRNYLLIDELDLDLGPGLTVLTGETGSGKSIIIGALGLALGQRAEGDLLRDPARRCVIELELLASGATAFAAEWCQRNNIPQEPALVLRRLLDPGGRSRAFVNDTPVRLDQLRELGEGLVHIHSQHHTLLLNNPAFQLGLLDHYAGQGMELKPYAGEYRAWRAAQEHLEALRREETQAQSDRDFLQFQLNELETARLEAGEQAELERALARSDHAQELLAALRGMEEGITGERAIDAQLTALRHGAQKAARVDPAVEALVARLHGAAIELKDIADEAARLAEQVGTDPKEAERLRERSDLLNRLMQKHHVEKEEDLISLREDLRERITRISSLAAQVHEAERTEARMGEKVATLAERISDKRTKAMALLADQLTGLLKELGMPHAVFAFHHARSTPGPMGMDTIRALFTANTDRPPGPLDKVASGGELSRVMLALISLAAESRELPTVIFDEIDTGVSGEVAHRVGALLKAMGQQRQVIAISHLPQIASKADTHLLVTKDQEAERVRSGIRSLDAKERVAVLARMLSGKKVTKAAMDNAKELLENR